MYCKDMRHWSGRKIEEQKAWANHYSCLTCSSSTYRLRLWVSDGLTLTLPYAYCVTCDAVASRAIETRGERKADGVKKCAGCNASISDRYKWCSNCKLRQIYGHGRLGPPQRRVRAEEADVKRNCVECGEEYLPNSGTQRFCTECAAARLRTSRRKPTPKKKPANELEVEIDFSAAVDGSEGAAALVAPAPAGRGRGRSRAGSRAAGALSLIALDAGGSGGPSSPVPPPVFDASLPGALCQPAEFEDLFPDAARPPAGADRGPPGGGSAEPAAGGSSGSRRCPGRPKKAAAAPPPADAAPPPRRRPGRPKKAAAAPPPAARPGAGGGLRAVDDTPGRGRTRGAAPGRAGAARGRSPRAASGAGREKKAAPGRKAAKRPAGRQS